MKKAVYILFGIFTLIIGIVAYYARPVVIPISLCEATQNAEFYQFNEIHIRGNLHLNKDGNSLSLLEIKKGCEYGNADLWFSENYDENLPKEKLSKELLNLIEQLKEQSTEDVQAVAEVEVTGKLVKRETACFSAPFFIIVKEIKQTSPIKLVNIGEEIMKARSEK